MNYSAHGSAVPTAGASDLAPEGGASLKVSREPGHEDLRSGTPGQTSTATLMHPLAGQGHYITAFSMSYRYAAGYNCLPGNCDSPPHIKVIAADATSGKTLSTLYTSPDLDEYSFDEYAGYSPLQTVNVDGLRVSNSELVLLKLIMVNGKHNLQIQLDPDVGLNMSVQWSSEIGPDPPTPPSPWLQPPTNGLGVTRGPLVFALHPTENRKVVKAYDNPPIRPQAVDNEIGTNDTWNYGLVPNKGFTFVPTASAGWGADFAFNDNGDYPFYISAVARQVKEWGYWQGSMITDVPPVSPMDCANDCGEETELHLVPFGGTNIRISVFPWMVEDSQLLV